MCLPVWEIPNSQETHQAAAQWHNCYRGTKIPMKEGLPITLPNQLADLNVGHPKAQWLQDIPTLLRSTTPWHSQPTSFTPTSTLHLWEPCPVTSGHGNCEQMHNTNQENFLLNHPSQAPGWKPGPNERNTNRGTRERQSRRVKALMSVTPVSTPGCQTVSEVHYRWCTETQVNGLLREVSHTTVLQHLIATVPATKRAAMVGSVALLHSLTAHAPQLQLEKWHNTYNFSWQSPGSNRSWRALQSLWNDIIHTWRKSQSTTVIWWKAFLYINLLKHQALRIIFHME